MTEASLFWANAVAIPILPLVYWQFWRSPSKPTFLLISFVASSLFALSFWLAGAPTAALVSVAGGISAVAQAVLASSGPWARWSVSVAAIAAALWIAPPDGFFAWLAAAAYAWVRVAETQRENLMRVMYIVSPLLWGLIAINAGNLMALPVDLLGFAMAIRWVVSRLDSASEARPTNQSA